MQKNSRGYDMLFVDGATASALAPLLNPKVPYVWILGHRPHKYVQWHSATLPLNEKESITGQVRLLTYDLQLTTAEFLNKLQAFENHGLTLVQAHRPMPNALDLARIPDDQQDKVLINNGAFLRLWLPHAVETACLVCYESGYLETVRV